MDMYQTVVVGTDGSGSSLRAGEIAANSNATLIITTGYSPQPEDLQAEDIGPGRQGRANVRKATSTSIQPVHRR